jgi:hypothetical protein
VISCSSTALSESESTILRVGILKKVKKKERDEGAEEEEMKG